MSEEMLRVEGGVQRRGHDAIYRAGRSVLACAPREAGRGGRRPDFARVRACPELGDDPTGGARLSAAKRRGAGLGRGRRWAGGGFWAAGKKRERKGRWRTGPDQRELDCAKRKEGDRGFYFFQKDSNNSIQI